MSETVERGHLRHSNTGAAEDYDRHGVAPLPKMWRQRVRTAKRARTNCVEPRKIERDPGAKVFESWRSNALFIR
jgi:hypothetical protein